MMIDVAVYENCIMLEKLDDIGNSLNPQQTIVLDSRHEADRLVAALANSIDATILKQLATQAAEIERLTTALDEVRTEYQRVSVCLAQSNQAQDQLRGEVQDLQSALSVRDEHVAQIVLDAERTAPGQDAVARALLPFDNDDLSKLFEDAINLFLEYRDQHGYDDEEMAKGMAISDLVDGVRAIVETDRFVAEATAETAVCGVCGLPPEVAADQSRDGLAWQNGEMVERYCPVCGGAQ